MEEEKEKTEFNFAQENSSDQIDDNIKESGRAASEDTEVNRIQSRPVSSSLDQDLQMQK